MGVVRRVSGIVPLPVPKFGVLVVQSMCPEEQPSKVNFNVPHCDWRTLLALNSGGKRPPRTRFALALTVLPLIVPLA